MYAINSGPVLPARARPRTSVPHPRQMLDEVGVVISQSIMAFSGPRVAARKIISVGVVCATNGTIIESDIVSAWG
jgi:hypothetical protein